MYDPYFHIDGCMVCTSMYVRVRVRASQTTDRQRRRNGLVGRRSKTREKNQMSLHMLQATSSESGGDRQE